MTFVIERRVRVYAHDHRPLPPNGLPQRMLGGAAVALVASLCVWTAFDLGGPGGDQTDSAGARRGSDLVVTRGDKLDVSVNRGDKLRVARPGAPALNVYASLFDARFSLGGAPETFTNSVPLPSDSDAAPATTQPPPVLASRNTPEISPSPSRSDQPARRVASPARAGPAPVRSALLRDNAQSDQSAADGAARTPTLFERLFGKPAPVTLAYAATDDTGLSAGRRIAAAGYDQSTAVYDISRHTVYMPDGTQLEAHSGLGNLLDDPRHADEKMRGVTPPNVYDLELREAPFHGVHALRMIPEDERRTFGRSGILAHTFMLGPNGDSNGCVSFRNYDAFLQAYLKHEVKKLAVVARLD
jgi:hypothetical protein